MRNYTRRRVLAVGGAATVAGALGLPTRAAADPVTDQARILSNTLELFAGTAEVNANPVVAARLDKIAATARTRLAALEDAGNGELFKGRPLGTSDPNLASSFSYLYEIALATRIPHGDPDLVDNVEVQRQVLAGLIWLHENYYGDQEQGYYGNWFHWEIGISQSVTKIFVLLADLIRAEHPDLMTTYVASMDAYLRNGKDGDVDLDSRFHTGANLADITTNRILQGALLGDEARITKGVDDQLTVFVTIDPYDLQHNNTDGYYADGSFIQHHSVAYTGSYGKVMLGRVIQMIKIMDGTDYAPGPELVSRVFGWVRDGFAPLIFEGWMMEIVKGRAISRTGTGYADVAVVVEAVVDLSGYATGEESLALKSFVKYLRETSRVDLDPASFVSPLSIVAFTSIMDDASVPAEDLNPERRSVAFNAMDKTVHRRPGFAFALARSSDRISKYEYMSGENLMPWFQGDGAHYLYLAGQDQTRAFGIDYLTGVEAYRLSGVSSPVENRQTIPELYGTLYYDNPDHPLEFTSSSESQNTYVYFPRGTNAFSGGATLDAYGAAGLVQSDDVAFRDKEAGLLPDDFVAYGNARSHRSWFMLDDEIVVLIAGLSDPRDRDVRTTIDSRIAAEGDAVTVTGALRNGRPWSADAAEVDLAWLHWHNQDQEVGVGYVFLDTPRIEATLETVSRSRRAVRLTNPDTVVTQQVFGASAVHRAGRRDGSLAFALVPNADPGDLPGYVDGPVSVLTNTTRAQGIQHDGLGLTAANVFADRSARVGPFTIDGQASVIMIDRSDGDVSVAVSDPTMGRETVTVRVRRPGLQVIESDDSVTVRTDAGGVTLTVNTHQAYGRSFTARFSA